MSLRPIPGVFYTSERKGGDDETAELFEVQLLAWGARRASVDDRPHPDTVRRIRSELGLVACQPRPWRPVTTVAAAAGGLPDLVRRDFTATAPGRRLVGDITYVRTWEGWLSLATVLDCFSKKVVGYAMADHMRADLVIDALRMAARNVTIERDVTIFHSDRGSQYLSTDFAVAATELGVRRSVGRTGVCWDNAWAESFNGTLKNERVNRTVYPTREHARKDITSSSSGGTTRSGSTPGLTTGHRTK